MTRVTFRMILAVHLRVVCVCVCGLKKLGGGFYQLLYQTVPQAALPRPGAISLTGAQDAPILPECLGGGGRGVSRSPASSNVGGPGVKELQPDW